MLDGKKVMVNISEPIKIFIQIKAVSYEIRDRFSSEQCIGQPLSFEHVCETHQRFIVEITEKASTTDRFIPTVTV